MSKKRWYELRVRERVGFDKWVKKSKFYEVHSPSEAVRIYRKHCSVECTIMWCNKDGRHGSERLAAQAKALFREIRREQAQPKTAFGELREFLGLGNELLRDLRKGGGSVVKPIERRGSIKNKKGVL